jgi:sirohydrochlorin cobaltochelatase
MTTTIDKRAPMAAAPIKYGPDGEVAWGDMWDTFCELAREGGPSHRGEMLRAAPHVDPQAPGYHEAAAEIVRGIGLVSGLEAAPAAPGWIAVRCPSGAMAGWLAESIREENVEARAEGARLLVPVAANFTLKGEVKNVITAVAKTTHYWREHLPPDVKRALAAEERMQQVWARVTRWSKR